MNRFACVCALLFSATSAAAKMSDADKIKATCIGWQLDRANLALMIEKQHDLRVALSTVEDTGQRPLAEQLVKNLSVLIDAAENAYNSSGKAYQTACNPN